jgi:acetoin utilization deacetylase AcuC-like enzyme
VFSAKGAVRYPAFRAPVRSTDLTLYYRHPASLEHHTGNHPENPGRLRAIEAALDAVGWMGLDVREPPRAAREQLERVHSAEHVAAIESLCRSGGGMIDLDTVASEGSWEAALRAAGAACEAVDRLLAAEAPSAFCGLRPPGHHAERSQAMGFCLFNNVAVAAAHAIATGGAERVLVLDWDVHHGNGTEAIFRASADVLYASIHEWPLYPGTGAAAYEGEGPGEGYTVNLPVPAGADSARFLALVQHVVVPVARAFRPGLIAISAGFDAHRADPLASCLVDEDGYRQMAASVRAVADELGAPLLVCLEGGYDPGALARSVLATLGGVADGVAPVEADPDLVQEERARLARRWPI